VGPADSWGPLVSDYAPAPRKLKPSKNAGSQGPTVADDFPSSRPGPSVFTLTCVPGRDTPLYPPRPPAHFPHPRTVSGDGERSRRSLTDPSLSRPFSPHPPEVRLVTLTGDVSSLSACGGVLRGWIHFDAQGRERMWSSSQASTRGVVDMGRVEAGPSHFPKRPAPRNSARYVCLITCVANALCSGANAKRCTRSASNSPLTCCGCANELRCLY